MRTSSTHAHKHARTRRCYHDTNTHSHADAQKHTNIPTFRSTDRQTGSHSHRQKHGHKDADTPVMEHAIFSRRRKTEVKVKNSMTSTRRKPRLPTVYSAAEISIFCVCLVCA
jgi:hypothetical protein